MKIKVLLSLVFAISAMAILSSYRLGPASFGAYDCTGAEGVGNTTNGGFAVQGCSANATCHTATTNLGTVITVDSFGVPVTSYVAGKSYTITISAVNNTGSILPVFGFQMATVFAANAGDTNAVQAGTWGTIFPTNVHLVPGGTSGTGLNIPILEHEDTLLATSGGGAAGSTYSVRMAWTAPAAGSGTVKVFGALNAGSYQDLAPSTLYQLATPVTLPEAVYTGINQIAGQLNNFIAYPTLMSDHVNVSFDLIDMSNVNMTLVSMNGQVVRNLLSDESVSQGNFKRSFDVNGISSGVYLLRLQTANGSIVTKVVKE